MSKKSILVISIVLLILIGAFLYFWYVWIPQEMEKDSKMFQDTEPPTLFGKNDYQIETRADGRYIVVDKVGLTAKVPEGWSIEKKKTPNLKTEEYYIRLNSSNYESSIIEPTLPGKGCFMEMSVWTSEEANMGIMEVVQDLKWEGKILTEGVYIKDGYTHKLIDIENHKAVEGKSTEDNKLSEFVESISIDIPLEEKNEIISIYTNFNPDYREKCTNIWQEFVNDISIEN